MAIEATDPSPLEQAEIIQATLLGRDLLIAFSNGTSVLLAGRDIKRLALTAPKMLVTEEGSELF